MTVLSAMILSLVSLALGHLSWSLGLLVSTFWSVLNFLLTVNLMKMAVLEKTKARLSTLLLLKFPVFYLFGFLILILKIFPVSSLWTGFSLVFIAMGATKICLKRA